MIATQRRIPSPGILPSGSPEQGQVCTNVFRKYHSIIHESGLRSVGVRWRPAFSVLAEGCPKLLA